MFLNCYFHHLLIFSINSCDIFLKGITAVKKRHLKVERVHCFLPTDNPIED